MDCNQEIANEVTKENLALEVQNKVADPNEKCDAILKGIMDWAENNDDYVTKYINYNSFDYESYYPERYLDKESALKKQYYIDLAKAI